MGTNLEDINLPNAVIFVEGAPPPALVLEEIVSEISIPGGVLSYHPCDTVLFFSSSSFFILRRIGKIELKLTTLPRSELVLCRW